MKKSLTRKERLRGKTALKRVFCVSRGAGAEAGSVSGPGARLGVAKNGLEYSRVVVSPVRGYGGAVARNRARRVAKEAYRCIKSSVKPGFDLAFILFPERTQGRVVVGDFSYGQRLSQFSFLLKKAGLLREN